MELMWYESLGEGGNLVARAINGFETSMASHVIVQHLSVTNSENFRGGEGAESIEWARIKSKKVLKTYVDCGYSRRLEISRTFLG